MKQASYYNKLSERGKNLYDILTQGKTFKISNGEETTEKEFLEGFYRDIKRIKEKAQSLEESKHFNNLNSYFEVVLPSAHFSTNDEYKKRSFIPEYNQRYARFSQR